MAKYQEFDILDYFIILNRWKILIFLLFFTSCIASYLLIYFFIPEKFDSSALIIPSESNGMGNFASLLKNFSGLPSIGGLKQQEDTDLFNTIIYSRSNLEKVVKKFGLYKEYDLNSLEKTLKELKSNITTHESNEGSFEITVRASSPSKSAEMTNYVVELLNKSVIDLHIKKSHDNRVFLEERYAEIKDNLKHAEDSLKYFQSKSGLFSALDQGKAIFETYAKMESDLAVKQLELSVYKKMYGENAGVTQNAELMVDEYQKKLSNVKNSNDNKSLLLSTKNLPENFVTFYRISRDIKIYTSILEFLIPMYEQARFEEEKNVPILQVIDNAVPPEKRAYPKRLLASLVIAALLTFLSLLFILVKMAIKSSSNEKIIYLRREFFKIRINSSN